MVCHVEELTTKVFNQCLKKNVVFNILEKIEYPENSPRVEYYATPFGSKIIEVLDQIKKLQAAIVEG